MQTIRHDNDTWKVLAQGVERDGMTYCHLASTTRGRQQPNGWVPNQSCDWVPTEMLETSCCSERGTDKAGLSEPPR